MGKKKGRGQATSNPSTATPNYKGPNSKKPAVCIISNFLYLGPVSAASNVAFLRSHEINVIVSVGRTPQPITEDIPTTKGPKPITYHRLYLTDQEDSDLNPCIERICEILDKALVLESKVLIHCFSAISRSPALVAAYLIKRRGYTLYQSLELLRAARPVVSPNSGFLNQLRQIESQTVGAQMGDIEGYSAAETTS